MWCTPADTDPFGTLLNSDLRPYMWTKTADEILERIARYLNRLPDSGSRSLPSSCFVYGSPS
jgi:hypothetical protein